MRKATGIVVAMMVLLAQAGAALAGAGSGKYEWRISFSNTDPNVQVAANPTGLSHLYLWYQGCNAVSPGGLGMSAADFAISTTANWTFAGFSPNGANGFLNAGSGNNLLLAVGGCPSVSQLAGDITFFPSGEGAAKLGISNNAIAVTVDCTSPTPAAWSWPDDILFIGARSTGFATGPQGWGHGCTVDPVDAVTWGGVKALYR